MQADEDSVANGRERDDSIAGSSIARRRVSVSVVVPCYNEKECLRESHARIAAACAEIEKLEGGRSEILFVNDGSRDETWSLIVEAAARDSRVIGINLSRNFGFQAALAAGLARATGERTMVIDADLQDPPELLPRLWEKMTAEDADVVYGKRAKRKGEGFLKKLTAKAFYRILRWLTDVDIPVDTGDFRLMNRRVVETLRALPEQDRFMRGLVSWVGFKHVPFEYDRDPRFAGQTKFNYRRMALFALDGITSFSIKPLRASILLGFALIGVCATVAAWAIWAWSNGKGVPGWTSIFVAQLFIGSLQLFVLGIIGEYVGRIFLQGKGRPAYVIASETGAARPASDARASVSSLSNEASQ